MKIKDFLKENRAMTGAEIAKELGVSRQAVSNTLKRTFEKLFNAVRKDHPEFNSFESAISIMVYLGIDDDEASKFFKLFPPNIRKKIEDDAKKYIGNK